MKEKLKNILKNKNFWLGLCYSFVLIFSILFSYVKGFIDGVLIDNEIRTEIIENGNEVLKSNKINVKKANDNIKSYPWDVRGESVKVQFNINEDFPSDIFNSINLNTLSNPSNAKVTFNLFYGYTENYLHYLDTYIVFTNYQDSNIPFTFYFEFYDNGIIDLIQFDYNNSVYDNIETSGAFSELDIYDFDISDLLNSIGAIINDLDLNNYYFFNEVSPLSEFQLFENNYFLNYVYVYDIQPDKSFINYLIDGAATLISLFGGLLVSAVLSISGIFYNNGNLTIIGAAMAFALVVGIVYLIFRMVRGLVKQNNRG